MLTEEEFDETMQRYAARFGDPRPDSRAVVFCLFALDAVHERLLKALASGEPIANWLDLENEILQAAGGELVLGAEEVMARF